MLVDWNFIRILNIIILIVCDNGIFRNNGEFVRKGSAEIRRTTSFNLILVSNTNIEPKMPMVTKHVP